MSKTADRLRELADTVEHVEDVQDMTVRDIDVRFVRPSLGPISQMMSAISGVQAERVPVFDLELGPADADEDDVDDRDDRDDGDDLDGPDADLEDDGVEIDLEDEDETAEAADGGGA